ncbi:hypothetical protein D9M73_219250 [compost metagenome]
MAGADGLGVLLRQFDQRVVVAGPAHQAGAGRLAEGQPEADAGHRAHQRLVDVFHRLDEMRLAENEVGVVRLGDLHGDEQHRFFPPSAVRQA